MHIILSFFIIMLFAIIISKATANQKGNEFKDFEVIVNEALKLHEDLIKKHIVTLSSKRKNLVYLNDYDLEDLTYWLEEMDEFTRNVILQSEEIREYYLDIAEQSGKRVPDSLKYEIARIAIEDLTKSFIALEEANG